MDERKLDLNFIICAHPKAGSTWLVHMLSSIIDINYTFDKLEEYIPIKNTKSKPYRIHKLVPVEGKRIILIRNPFDTILSWENYSKLRNKNFGSLNLNRFYSSILDKDKVVLYENLVSNPNTTLTDICIYLNWKVDIYKISNAVIKCSMENLKEYENTKLETNGKFLFYDKNQQIKNKVRFYNKGVPYRFLQTMDKSKIESIYNKYKIYIDKYWPEIKERI